MILIRYAIKILQFIKRYIKRDPLLLFYYIPAVFQKDYRPYKYIHLLNDELLTTEINNGKSIIRLGDGEMAILHGQDIGYQKFDSELRNYFKKIIKNYNTNSNYLIGIPYYINQSNEELKKDPIKFSIWLHLKVEFVRSFHAKEKYFDAHYFYQKEYCIPFIEQNLLNNSVIIVSNNTTKEKIIHSQIYQKNDFKSIDFIETPSENSFSEFQTIISKIDNLLSSNEYQQYSKKEIKLVFSAGPTSKVLVYYFSQKGCISYDIGYGIRYLWDQKDVSYKI